MWKITICLWIFLLLLPTALKVSFEMVFNHRKYQFIIGAPNYGNRLLLLISRWSIGLPLLFGGLAGWLICPNASYPYSVLGFFVGCIVSFFQSILGKDNYELSISETILKEATFQQSPNYLVKGLKGEWFHSPVYLRDIKQGDVIYYGG